MNFELGVAKSDSRRGKWVPCVVVVISIERERMIDFEVAQLADIQPGCGIRGRWCWN